MAVITLYTYIKTERVGRLQVKYTIKLMIFLKFQIMYCPIVCKQRKRRPNIFLKAFVWNIKCKLTKYGAGI